MACTRTLASAGPARAVAAGAGCPATAGARHDRYGDGWGDQRRAGSSAGVGLAAPATTATSDPERSVTGVEVQGVEGVSGIPLTAAAGAHVKQDQAADSGEPVAIGVVLVLSVGALAGLLLPWPVFAADLRDIGGTDHTRARRIPPFRPLGR